MSLVIRAKLQQALFSLGCCAQRHASKVILLGLLFLTVFAMGLMRAKLETDAETLWIESKWKHFFCSVSLPYLVFQRKINMSGPFCFQKSRVMFSLGLCYSPYVLESICFYSRSACCASSMALFWGPTCQIFLSTVTISSF